VSAAVVTRDIPWTDLTAWQPQGRCYDTGDDRFLTDDQTLRQPSADVLIICGQCPVRKQCLEYALETEAPDGELGVWGATTPYQRRQLKAERSRVRCPACQALDTVVPEGRGEICVACGVSWII